MVAFYAALLVLAWNGRPRDSTVTILLGRLRGGSSADANGATPVPSRPLSASGIDFPPDPRGPYLHQPLFRAANDDEYYSTSHANGHDEADDGSDIDEDTRQRRIEEEMGRRDVSIVTVPKRKLWVANPS